MTTSSPTAGPVPRGRPVRHRFEGEDGVLALEWGFTLPFLVGLLLLILASGHVVRDALVLQESARVAARVASVSSGTEPAVAAARAAAPELDELTVVITPERRAPGDPVEVRVTTTGGIPPVRIPLTARSVARVEPGVADVPTAGPWPGPGGPSW